MELGSGLRHVRPVYQRQRMRRTAGTRMLLLQRHAQGDGLRRVQSGAPCGSCSRLRGEIGGGRASGYELQAAVIHALLSDTILSYFTIIMCFILFLWAVSVCRVFTLYLCYYVIFIYLCSIDYLSFIIDLYLLDFVDYLEWLPSAGIQAGWSSIRHYAGQLSTFSQVCGWGSITDVDALGYQVWQENFAANVKIRKAPRGGDKPLRPWHLRRLAAVYNSGSAWDAMWLSTWSQVWFTTLRPGHFSPQSTATKHMKHMLEWAHIQPTRSYSTGVPRQALHYFVPSAKNRQHESSEDWSTATCCICEGADASGESHGA